jgi:hypothetical protein
VFHYYFEIGFTIDNWRAEHIYSEADFPAQEGESREALQKPIRRMSHSIHQEDEVVRSCSSCYFFRNCSAARKEICKVSADRTHGEYVEWRSRK